MQTDMMNVKVTLIEQNGIEVPHLIADRELVLFYFDYRNQRDQLYDQLQQLSPDDSTYGGLLKIYKEFKARCMRLEKAIYFQCEETGELRLFSSLVLHNDKIVWSKVPRDQKREELRKLKEETKMKVKKAQLLQKRQQKEQEQQKRRELALAKRGKTELECQIMDGRVTEEDLKKISMVVTLKELEAEMRTCARYYRGSVEQLEKFAQHNIILSRIRKMWADEETAKRMQALRSTMSKLPASLYNRLS